MPTSNAAAACFAMFVFAGYYKAADFLQFLPVDLTLLFAAATLAFCGHETWRTRSMVPGVAFMLVVFLAMTIGLHWPENLGAYAEQKELRLFSLTALSAFAPLVLLRHEDQCRVFVYTVCFLGLVMAGIAAVEAVSGGLSRRAVVFNANPILLARASGFSGLLLCLLYWQGRLSVWTLAPTGFVVLVGLLVSGTRAPLLAFLLTALAVAPLALRGGASRARVWGALVMGLMALAGALAYLASERIYGVRRIGGLLAGDWGATGESRLALWDKSLALIPLYPFGLGWGRFNEWVQVFDGERLLRHPHNILLEVTLEAGWLAGATLVALVALALAWSIRRTYRGPAKKKSPAEPLIAFIVPAALMYWLICAAFSGDVNDNRPLWAVLGMALAIRGSWRFAKVHDIEATAKDGNVSEPHQRA